MVDQAQNLRDLMQQRTEQARSNSSSSNLTMTHISRPAMKGRLLTIVSGKGGVGKSNVALNLAIAYGSIGKKTIILDADLGMANVNVLMGIVPRYNISHIMNSGKKLKDVVVETEYGISLMAGASGISHLANADEETRLHFLEEIGGLSDYDIIIVDTGAGASSNVVAFAEVADDVIIVTTQEPTAITDAYSMVKILSQDCKQPLKNLHLVINRVYSAAEGEKVANKLLGISKQFLNVPLDYLGFVYEDSFVRDSVRKQKPFFWKAKNSRSSQCISQLMNRLENREDSQTGVGLAKFFSRLFKNI